LSCADTAVLPTPNLTAASPDLLLVGGNILLIRVDHLPLCCQLHFMASYVLPVGLYRLHVDLDLLYGRMQARLNHLGCFQVVAVDRNCSSNDPALGIRHSVDIQL